jgi:hypothetical protein
VKPNSAFVFAPPISAPSVAFIMPSPMPPPIGRPENVATSIHAWATGGFTTCFGGVWASAAVHAAAMAMAVAMAMAGLGFGCV